MLSSITVCVVTHESLFLCVCVCGWGGPCTEIDHVKQRLLSAPQSINVWAFKLHTVSFLHTPGYTLMQTNTEQKTCTGCASVLAQGALKNAYDVCLCLCVSGGFWGYRRWQMSTAALDSYKLFWQRLRACPFSCVREFLWKKLNASGTKHKKVFLRFWRGNVDAINFLTS